MSTKRLRLSHSVTQNLSCSQSSPGSGAQLVLVGYQDSSESYAALRVARLLANGSLPFELPAGLSVIASASRDVEPTPELPGCLQLEVNADQSNAWKATGADGEVYEVNEEAQLEKEFRDAHGLFRVSLGVRLNGTNFDEACRIIDASLAASLCNGQLFFTNQDDAALVSMDTTSEYIKRMSNPTSSSVKSKKTKGSAKRDLDGDVQLAVEFPGVEKGAIPVELYTSTEATDNKVAVVSCRPSNGPSIFAVADVLVYGTRTEPFSMILDRSREALKQQISKMRSQGGSTGQLPRAFHFLNPDHLPFAVTLLAPGEVDEGSYEETQRREAVHSALGLSRQPLLRRRCSLDGKAGALPGRSLLVDVHLGVSIPRGFPASGKDFLVKGSYSYHHYMQDKFDDNGWGCAYRSLQTLISWAVASGYADIAIPGHREIQETLHAMDDKPKSFIGSRDWIGANEVCYVLEHYTDVSSRILHVPSGAEIESKARELAQHFERHGTPVMIGGGVLAYTLLGVRFDEVTGSALYLILDPHYIGPEDPDLIRAKGWCGWKKADLFVRNAFYNFCLPQRPSMV